MSAAGPGSADDRDAPPPSPESLRARLAELREAGLELRRRPPGEILDTLARLLDAWTDPRSRWRRELAAQLPAATGFSPECVAHGLERALQPWSGAAFLELAARELPERRSDGAARFASGFASTAVLLAGSIPMPTLTGLLAPLALRSPVLAKCAARDRVTAPLFARSLAEVDAELGQCLAVVAFPGEDVARSDALLEADCVVATGSDATVARVLARVKPPRRCVTYGHRTSVAVLGAAATRGAPLDAATAGLALDVALWDQLGCCSPIGVYVVDADTAAADRVAEALASALEAAEARIPRGAIAAAAAAQIAHERSEAEVRAAAGRAVALHQSRGTAWTVVREEAATLRPAPLHRFIRVLPVRDAATCLDALQPLGPHLAGVALAGFGRTRADLARSLAELGASRICQPGALQSPPLDWPRDNLGVLTPLARLASIEASSD